MGQPQNIETTTNQNNQIGQEGIVL